MPDEDRRFLVKPNWNEEIYLSTPDILGNVTVNFYVAPLSGPPIQQAQKHYIGDMEFHEAVRLIRKYCMLSPEYCWYSWNRPCKEQWEKIPATDNQKWKLEQCYKKFGFDSGSLGALNKLEASAMIDVKMEMDQKASYVKAFKVTERQRKSTRDKKLLAFQELEAQDQQDIQDGRDAFPAFQAALEKAYSRRNAEIRAAREREKKAMAKEAMELERGYFEADITVRAYSGSVTPKQDGFIQSLVNQAARQERRRARL